MKSMRSRTLPAPQQGIAPPQVLELIDEALTKLTSEEGVVSRRDAIDAFLELRLAVVTADAVERFLRGDDPDRPGALTEDASAVRA
jgi:hypothetical protein